MGPDMDDTPQEITSLVGREVYSNNGIFVGEVEDLQLNVDGEAVTGLALGSLNGELFSDEARGGPALSSSAFGGDRGERDPRRPEHEAAG